MNTPITIPLWAWLILMLIVCRDIIDSGKSIWNQVKDWLQLKHCKKHGHDYDEERVLAMKNCDEATEVFFLCKRCGELSKPLDLSEWPSIAYIVEEHMHDGLP